jgi:ribosomal protein L12E/L44/L45/RPP1/RPP2
MVLMEQEMVETVGQVVVEVTLSLLVLQLMDKEIQEVLELARHQIMAVVVVEALVQLAEMVPHLQAALVALDQRHQLLVRL